jgi:hypothetical protein
MSFNRLNISDFIEQQLPDFISEDFSVFINFFTEYYKSLEIKGASLDISNNILEYLDLDNLTKSNLVKTAILYQNINSTTSSIRLNSLYGFEKTNGIVSIDDEIIFYQDVDTLTNTLLNCKRGYSATTELKEIGTTVTSTTAAAHTTGSVVKNLSNLFLFSIIKNYGDQYLEGFPYTQIDSDIDVVTLIKNIKDFYSSKGTSVSIQFLFRCIFDEEITVKYPKDYVIKASYSDWTIDDIIKVEAITGDPYDLVGNQLKQTDVSNSSTASAILDTIIVNNITNYPSGNKNIYEIRLNILNRSNFKVPSKTILRRNLSSTDSVITVDSTIGFPERNGIIQIDDEIITYRYKSFNQFFDCNRGSYSTTKTTHINLSLVKTTEYLYGYSGGIENPENIIKMKLVGFISEYDIIDGSSYYNDIDPIQLTSDGIIDSRKQFTTWRINEVGNLSSSSNVEIDDRVKNLSTEVSAVYKTDSYAYIASTGLPNYPIGSFIDVASNVGNQYLLKTIPLETEKITQVQPVGNRSIGLFVNGVEAFSCQDLEYETFGDVTAVNIVNNGYGFEDNIQPVFRINNVTASGATFSANIVNGKIATVNVLNGGSNYTSDAELEIAYGFDATASILNAGDIVKGSIKTISVTNPGNNYIVAPNVVITDNTGKGKGAFAKANINNGIVTSIDVLSEGIDYSDKSNVIVKLVSKGAGVVANIVTRKWNYDRVFKLNYTQNSTTKNWSISTLKKTDPGNGYLYPSNNIAYGLEYAYAFNPKILRNNLNDNVGGTGSDYAEVTSGFVHSPIIGWAYDGNPIYGPYGYSNPLSTSSSIRRIVGSYRLVTSSSNRPSTTLYPLGAFIEDYEFVNGLGDLDTSNGRFCKTPDFPEGRYCYFITVNSFGAGIFPYILGKTYNSVPSKNNTLVTHNQEEYNLPQTSKRIRTNNTPSEGYDARLLVNSVERGSVDSYKIGYSAKIFKINDYLFVDSTNTEGAGALANVEAIGGVTVSSVTYAVASGFTASGVTVSGGLSQFAFPTSITSQSTTIPYEAYVTTNTPHLLSDNDVVYLNIDKINLQVTKTFKVRTSSYQTIKYNKPSFNTTLDSNVSFNQTTVNVISSSGFRNNDYITINDEILKITSINYSSNQLTVTRSQFNTPLRLHNTGNKVSLYIPNSDADYRIQVGNALSSSGVSGVIYNVDKENSIIEVRILSGTLTNSSVVNDSSTTISRPVSISSVTTKKVYWEIDPTNTGNYYVRDLSFEMIRNTRYIFDISDSSNIGYNLIFSEDSSNINEITSVVQSGTAGFSGATVTFSEEILNDELISRIYYFEQNNLIQNNKIFFTIKDSYIENSHIIKVVNNNTFKYSLSGQPEKTTYSGVTYYTYSKSAVGDVVKIKNIDGGGGYKKLPLVKGLVHSELDNAKFKYSLSSGGIQNNIQVVSRGNRYSNNTIIEFVSSTGTGAILIPTIVNGNIESINVVNAGRNYTSIDTIVAIDTAAQIFPVSNSIGKIKSIRISNYGSQFNTDRTLSKELSFNYKLIISNLSDEVYKNFEYLYTSSGATLRTVSSQQIGVNSYLLEVELIDGKIIVGDVITGSIKQTTSIIYEVKTAKVYGNISGYINRFGFFDSDLGKLSSSSQKITDSYYYQDFSYVIRSTRSLKDYKSKVDRTVHPLGFKLFGEVAIEGSGNFVTSGVTDSSVFLPRNHSNHVVIIAAPEINVESTINYKKYEIQTINTRNLSTIDGEGAAALNFLENQIDAVKMDDISNSFNSSTTQFNLSSTDGNFPTDTKNSSIILCINEIFQEPIERKNISQISYVNNVATITTAGNHGYAYTQSGVTYPVDQYVHIEGVTYSGYNINLNDKFEIYSVDNSNTFKILFNNFTVPSGIISNSYLTNAKLVKGEFEYANTSIKLFEPPKEGSVFYSVFFKFLNGTDNERYSYKLQNIIFDGSTTTFDLRKSDGTNISTLVDENLLIFVDGVLQIYGESYSINRTTNPNQIVFNSAYEKERQFFGYTFSKYKILNDISSKFNASDKIFDLKYLEENIKSPDIDQILVLLDGVPQNNRISYTINDNLLIFTEPPTSSKKCQILYFYGKTFEKTIAIWNGRPFEKIVNLGKSTNNECETYAKYSEYEDLITPGDLIEIDGETPKELISFDTSIIKYSDNYEYNASVYTDNSFIFGKNAVGIAVMSSGVPITNANTVTLSGTVSISGTTAIPAFYDYGVSRVNVVNFGMDYNIPPIVIFKTACNNPGTGAAAYAVIENKQVRNVVVTNPGSGYTSQPDVLFLKKYKIIKQKYPVKISKEIIVDSRLNDGNAAAVSLGLNILQDRYEQYDLPYISTQITTSFENQIQIESVSNQDPSQPGLSYVLANLESNKFTYQPFEPYADLNSQKAPYLYQGMSIELFSRYFPNLTINDFNIRPGRTTGSNETNIMNIGQDAYATFGATLASGITSSGTTIVASGVTSLAKFPSPGYIEFGNETISYTSISGVTLLNCNRGINSTSAVSHNQGDYFNLSWIG